MIYEDELDDLMARNIHTRFKFDGAMLRKVIDALNRLSAGIHSQVESLSKITESDKTYYLGPYQRLINAYNKYQDSNDYLLLESYYAVFTRESVLNALKYGSIIHNHVNYLAGEGYEKYKSLILYDYIFVNNFVTSSLSAIVSKINREREYITALLSNK